MKIDEMNLEEVEARLAEISADYEKRSGEELENLKAEVIELNQRKALLIEAEERKNTAKAIEDGKVEVTTIEERKEETKMEMRDSLEYGKAFIKAVLTGDESEARALLTENVNGNIPVPTMLDNEIRNAWEEAALLSLVKQTNYPGNVKVGFEYSATGAVVHVEGTAAPDEEVLELGTVELKAESIKKWITVSDEAIEAAVKLSNRYINDRNLPDKAIDLIDEASAAVRLKNMNIPENFKEMQAAIKKFDVQIERSIRMEAFSRASELRQKQEETIKKYDKAMAKYEKTQSQKSHYCV